MGGSYLNINYYYFWGGLVGLEKTKHLMCLAVPRSPKCSLVPKTRRPWHQGPGVTKGRKPVNALQCLSLLLPARPCVPVPHIGCRCGPSTRWKSQNKGSAPRTSTNCWGLAEESAWRGGSLRFPYVEAQPDSSVCGIKPQEPGCQSETSGEGSQESPDPQGALSFVAPLKCISVFTLFFCICPQMPGLLYHYFANWNGVCFGSLNQPVSLKCKYSTLCIWTIDILIFYTWGLRNFPLLGQGEFCDTLSVLL